MGQKVNPHGLRVGVIKNWDSRWFAEKGTFGDTLVEDYNVRNFILKELNTRSKNPADKCVYAGVPKVEIERFADKDGGQKVRIHIHCAKPGIVIGRGGAEIEKLRANVEKMIGKSVAINIVEVKQPASIPTTAVAVKRDAITFFLIVYSSYIIFPAGPPPACVVMIISQSPEFDIL